MSVDQKRTRRDARYFGKLALRDIERAISDQLQVAFYREMDGFEHYAQQWQRMSDRAVEGAASYARRAVKFARLSQETPR